ncbi:hypothetical protein H6P81_008854 [Aristolochia fimbriata]|uniref:CBF1-interacting co-repressor CIR N-terminal domain-containing protein n=1 Tax=Aristolochia fimbriata TaxID=158543 RepID=A0AAV7EJJ5_ARIFI|nr:hypothetical protein H6P81_008854 [Aristolochia fimbriata]
MALKFLNKKGWHTGSLRNIENVWKAEQKHDAEQKKLEELKKQIQEERERAEFRQLQEQAGLVPRQERLDFLYDSGLAVGKGSSSGFKELEAPPKPEADSSTSKQSSVPGALFEDKPQSANDTWRKLHSDPLLLIRQREQEALARIKNNPVQMAMIRKSAETMKKQKEEKHDRKAHKKKHRKKSRHSKHSSEEESDADKDTVKNEGGRRRTHLESDFQGKSKHGQSSASQLDSERHSSDYDEEKRYKSQREGGYHKNVMAAGRIDGDDGRHGNHKEGNPHKHQMKNSSRESDSEGEKQGKKLYRKDADGRNKKHQDGDSYKSCRNYASGDSESERKEDRRERNCHRNGDHHLKRIHDTNYSEVQYKSEERTSRREDDRKERSSCRDNYNERWNHEKFDAKSGPSYREEDERRRASHPHGDRDKQVQKNEEVRLGTSRNKQHPGVSKLTVEEKAARAREMQLDAELHEEQRWKRLKKASEADAREAARNAGQSGRNFLDSAQKSVYGTEKGGSATIEESVRRQSYYLQGRLEEGNAFRR